MDTRKKTLPHDASAHNLAVARPQALPLEELKTSIALGHKGNTPQQRMSKTAQKSAVEDEVMEEQTMLDADEDGSSHATLEGAGHSSTAIAQSGTGSVLDVCAATESSGGLLDGILSSGATMAGVAAGAAVAVAVATKKDDENKDSTPPTFAAGTNSTVTLAENSPISTVVHTAIASDNVAVVAYAFADGADDDKFTINAATGAITFKVSPDFENPGSAAGSNSYTVKIRATDAAGNSAVQTVTVDVTDAEEIPPVFDAGDAITVQFAENSPISAVVHTATASDNVAIVAYAFAGGADVDKFNIDAATGAISFKASPDFETPGSAAGSNSYTVQILATDAAGNSAAQTLTVDVADVDDQAPVFDAGETVQVELPENIGNEMAVHTATAQDGTYGVEYSFAGGVDDGLFTLNSSTGALFFKTSPDFETPESAQGSNRYTVKIRASDYAGNSAVQTVTLSVTDVAIEPVMLSAVAMGRGGFVINGQSADDYSGYSVANAGDVNGDGLDDVIIGASYADPAAGSRAGRSYVVFGKANNSSVDLRNVVAGVGGFVIHGEAAEDLSGDSVSGAGDVNGDGLADLIVGAPRSDPNNLYEAGRSYVVFGKSDTLAVNLSAITSGAGGFVINGTVNYEESGSAVSSAGDVNGDGLADLIVGAPFWGNGEGRTCVVFGKSGTSAVNLGEIGVQHPGLVITGQAAYDSSGYSVSSAGDVNGDGLADLIIGADNADPSGMDFAGRSYVVFGRAFSSTIDLNAVAAGSGGFVINGQAEGDFSGKSVSSAGDVNGDGLADLLIGAYSSGLEEKAGAGRSYVVFGKTDTTVVNLAQVAGGQGGFVIHGQDGNDWSGYSVSGVGDVNGDGLADLLIGAPIAWFSGGSPQSRSYLVFGKADTLAVDLHSVAAGVGGVLIQTASERDGLGVSVSGAGDVNGDGLADLIVGAGSANSKAGRSYVIFGSTTGAFASTSTVDAIGTTGDDVLSDDGSAKTLVGNTGNDTFNASAASVLYGGAGNDVFNIGAAMIAALQNSYGEGGNLGHLARIDGGSGIDTLALAGSNLTLDLSMVSNIAAVNPDGGSRMGGIEHIDLRGTGSNTLKLNALDVRDMAGFNSFEATGRRQVMVTGDSDDNIDLFNAWGAQAGTTTIGGSSYRVWNHGASQVTLYVGEQIQVLGVDSEAPVFAAGALLELNVEENARPDAVLHTVAANDNVAVVSYSFAGGADDGLFRLGNTTGKLYFRTSPDFETPRSSLGSNSYTVLVRATDAAGNSAIQSITVQVTDVLPVGTMVAGTGGFAVFGPSADNSSGASVSNAGDVNGDGLLDLLIGSYNSYSEAKKDSYVVFGKTSSGSVDLNAVALGTGGFALKGQSVGDLIGLSVSSAGDVNGDGLADVIVGAPGFDTSNLENAGRTYVVFGKKTTTAVDLSAVVAGSGGFVIDGQAAGKWSGASVSSAGDVNGDGLTDLIIGASGTNPNDTGRSYVVFGKKSTTAVNLTDVAAGTGGFAINGRAANDGSGASVSAGGDINGDGLADLLIGAPYANLEVGYSSGISYVVFGKTDTSAVDLESIAAGGGGFAIEGNGNFAYSGMDLSNAGDVNGDGLADLIIGASGASIGNMPDAGRSYVVFGKADGTTINLSAVAEGTGGFVINGEAEFDSAGASVSGAGDINGDGLADMIVNSKGVNAYADIPFGRSYVVFGKTDTRAVNLSSTADTHLNQFFVIKDPHASEYGSNASYAGDVNGDGLADVIVGSPHADSGAGRSYVVFGSTTGAFASSTTVDSMGTTGADLLSDDGTAKTLVGNSGNDTFTASAASVLYGGAGIDVFNIGAEMITALQNSFGAGGNLGQLARIDGGTGIDILALAGSGLTLDLGLVSNVAAGNPDGGSRIDGIEHINLRGTGNNTLKLSATDVRDMAGFNSFEATGRRQLLVSGDNGDRLDLIDDSGTSGWTLQAASSVINGATHSVWHHNTSLATLYVQQGVAVI